MVSRPRLASSSFFGFRLFFLLFFSLAAFQSKLAILGKLTPIVTCDWKWISKHSTTYHLHIMANRSIGGVFPITQLNSEQPHKFTARSERPHRAGRGWAQEWGRGREKKQCTFQKGRRQEDNGKGWWVLHKHKPNTKQRELMDLCVKGRALESVNVHCRKDTWARQGEAKTPGEIFSVYLIKYPLLIVVANRWN